MVIRIWVHPRAGGENTNVIATTTNPPGPSPRWRGKLPIVSASIRQAGSIPALAGKTVHEENQARVLRVHPRAGGENPIRIHLGPLVQGPSPRWRGKPAVAKHAHLQNGSIPALAGKTSV